MAIFLSVIIGEATRAREFFEFSAELAYFHSKELTFYTLPLTPYPIIHPPYSISINSNLQIFTNVEIHDTLNLQKIPKE